MVLSRSRYDVADEHEIQRERHREREDAVLLEEHRDGGGARPDEERPSGRDVAEDVAGGDVCGEGVIAAARTNVPR